jgi:hypothetical protein
MANERLGISFGSGEPQEPYPLPYLNLITLITYQFSFLLFVCLACLWASLYLRTLPYCTVVGLSTVPLPPLPVPGIHSGERKLFPDRFELNKK